MEYQHLVFEEFARTLSPTIDPAPFNESTYHTDIDAAIPAEFAHVVYRFGHSMLNDTLPRRGFGTSDISLFNGFLNPPAFTANGTLSPDQAAGSLVNGLVAQTGNGIDEFVDDTLRNQLLGQPLDLATLNMARARETGTPPLQTVRAWFHDRTGDPALRPYEDWADFEAGLKHPRLAGQLRRGLRRAGERHGPAEDGRRAAYRGRRPDRPARVHGRKHRPGPDRLLGRRARGGGDAVRRHAGQHLQPGLRAHAGEPAER